MLYSSLFLVYNSSIIAIRTGVFGFLTFISFDIMGLLFGDILAVTVNDLYFIWGLEKILILFVLKLIWKDMEINFLASTVNYEFSSSNCRRVNDRL